MRQLNVTFANRKATIPLIRKESSIKPHLEVIGIERSVERYRCVLSDDEHFMQGMLATESCESTKRGALKKNSIIVVKDYAWNSRICIVHDLEVIEQCSKKC